MAATTKRQICLPVMEKGKFMHKQYLGDSVYADFDGYGITLTTENGFGPSNTIYLESAVLQAMDDYRAYLKRTTSTEGK